MAGSYGKLKMVLFITSDDTTYKGSGLESL